MQALIPLIVVTFVAGTIQGLVGFGFSLLAASIFLLVIGSGEAVQLLIIINLAISLALVGPLWKDVDRALLVRLAGGAVVGLPLGLWVYSAVDIEQLKVIVGAVVLLFVGAQLVRSGTPSPGDAPERQEGGAGAIATGTIAGALTTALGMPGPPVVVYLSSLGVAKDVTRSTMLTFFALTYSASLVLQVTTMGVSRDIWIDASVLTPVAALAAAFGHWCSKFVSEAAFRTGVLVLLAATGAYVLFEALVQ